MNGTERFLDCEFFVDSPLFFGGARIGRGTSYSDVRDRLAGLPDRGLSLALMVACDSCVGEWHDRSGTTDTNLISLVRGLAQQLNLSTPEGLSEFTMSSAEATKYYEELVERGVLAWAVRLGLSPIDIYCTLRRCINAVIGRAVMPQQEGVTDGGEVSLNMFSNRGRVGPIRRFRAIWQN